MKFRYKKIAMTVSVIVMGIGMITLSTKIPSVDDSTALEQQETKQQDDGKSEGKTAQPESETENADKTDEQAGQQTTASDTTDEVVAAVAQDKGLEKNAYPAVNKLITDYMNAKLECDEKKLADLVDDATYLDMTDIQKRTERIEEYVTIDCYTLAGPEENSYMTYVYSEVKVTGVETLASGLDGFYIRTDADDKLKITMGELSEEVSEKLSEAAEREDVKQLIADVNEKFVAEVSKDEELAKYYEELSIVDVLEEEKENKEDQAAKEE